MLNIPHYVYTLTVTLASLLHEHSGTCLCACVYSVYLFHISMCICVFVYLRLVLLNQSLTHVRMCYLTSFLGESKSLLTGELRQNIVNMIFVVLKFIYAMKS